jgi:hypothetical protein
MNRALNVYGVLVIVLHVLHTLWMIDPFADASAGDRIPPSQMGPNGPVFVPVGFLGGK